MIFKIIIVQQTNPLTYLLENSCGELIAEDFYEYTASLISTSMLLISSR